MCLDPPGYPFAKPGIRRISDCITVRFGFIEGHGRTTGEDRGEKEQNEYPAESTISHILFLVPELKMDERIIIAFTLK
jgi:hypothetical protein